MGGIVVDSFTPSLQKKGGKGVLGGGKNSGEVKFGTYQVLIGEGERFWNDKINDGFNTEIITYTLQDRALTNLPDLIEKTEYETINTAYSAELGDYSVTALTDNFINKYTVSVSKNNNPNLNAFTQQDDVNNFLTSEITGAWTIPSTALGSLQSITVGFTVESISSTGFNRVSFQPTLIQNGVKFFTGERSNPPYWEAFIGSTGTFYLTISRADLLSIVKGSGDLTSQTHLTPSPPDLDLSEGALPIEIGMSLQPATSSTGYSNGTATLVLSEVEVSYRASNINTGGALQLNKIWMNDEIWYNTETTNDAQVEQNNNNQQYFTFYDGILNQGQDPSLVALRGADKVPGLQGYSHIVFHNLPLDKWSNNYPTVKIQVTSSLDATPETIIRDTMFRAGARYNKPLIEGKDWAFALNDDGTPAIDSTTYSNVVIDGYVAKYDSSDLKTILSDVAQIFRVSILCNPSTNPEFSDYAGFFPNIVPLYKVVPTSFNKTIDVEAEVLGTAEADEDSLPWPTKLEGKSADEIPGQVEVQYNNLNKGGERESVLVDRATFQLASNYTFSPNYYAERRVGTANAIAKFIIYQGLARAKQTTTSSFPNQLLGLQNLVNWEGDLTLRPQKLTLGADGTYEVVGITISDEDLQEEFVEDVVNDLQDPGNIAVDVGVVWTEGQSILAPATGKRRTIYGWLAPPASSAIGNPASILISYDGGSFGTTSVNAVEPNAQFITINSIPSENLNDFRYYNVDTTGVINVTVPDGIELLSVDLEFILEGTKNIIYIQNYGFVGFQTATLTGTNTYDLTNLFWNVGQGLIDEGWRVAQTATEGLLLLGSPYEIEIPTSTAKGTSIALVAATSADNSATFTRPYKALNSSPRHVTNFSVLYGETNQDIELSWVPYIDQDTQILPSLFSDPPVTGDTYTLIIREGGTTIRTETNISIRGFDYTEALQTTDGVVNRANLTYEVIQEGIINTMDSSVEYNHLGMIVGV